MEVLFSRARNLLPRVQIFVFIIKSPCNAHSDWLKQRALSENKARVDYGELAFEFVTRNFDKLDPN